MHNLSEQQFMSIDNDIHRLLKLLSSIVKSMKNKISNHSNK